MGDEAKYSVNDEDDKMKTVEDTKDDKMRNECVFARGGM